MRNLLALLGALVVVFFGAGYFLGWYKIGTAPGPDGQPSVNIGINTKKIGSDIKSGVDKVRSLAEKTGKDSEAKVEANPPQPAPPSGADPMPWWAPTAQPWEPGYTQEPGGLTPRPDFGPARQPEDVNIRPRPER